MLICLFRFDTRATLSCEPGFAAFPPPTKNLPNQTDFSAKPCELMLSAQKLSKAARSGESKEKLHEATGSYTKLLKVTESYANYTQSDRKLCKLHTFCRKQHKVTEIYTSEHTKPCIQQSESARGGQARTPFHICWLTMSFMLFLLGEYSSVRPSLLSQSSKMNSECWLRFPACSPPLLRGLPPFFRGGCSVKLI